MNGKKQKNIKPRDLWSHNTKGVELCHAKFCRKTKELIEEYRGKWCKTHYNQLTEIRRLLKEFAKNGNIHEEMIKRREEDQFRKTPDPKHLHYLRQLENRYVNGMDCYAGYEECYKDISKIS